MIGCEPGTVLTFGHQDHRVLVAFYDADRHCTGSESVPPGQERHMALACAYFTAQLLPPSR